MHDRIRRAAATTAVAAAACLALAAPGPGTAVLISLGEGGALGNGDSYEGSVANNGKIVAFYSDADNLVAGDGNGQYDVFVRDLRTGAVELISRDAEGNEGTSWSYFPTLSANGRWVMYYTRAENLATGASVANNRMQAVIHDRRTGETVEITRDFDGGPADATTDLYDTRPLSANGRYAVFYSAATDLVPGDANGFNDVFLADLRAGTVERISNGIGAEADGQSRFPCISPNGRWVTFVSEAENLVADDDNGNWDVFLYDVKRRTTTLVSLSSDGAQGNGDSGGTSEFATSASNNGRLVVFKSGATNFDALHADTNGFQDIFLRDLKAGTTKRISLGPAAVEGNQRSSDPWLDPAGRKASFFTYAGNLVDGLDDVSYDQLLYDLKTGALVRMLPDLDGGPGGSGTYGYWNGMSANGRWFACSADSGAILEDGADDNGNWDVYRVDLK